MESFERSLVYCCHARIAALARTFVLKPYPEGPSDASIAAGGFMFV